MKINIGEILLGALVGPLQSTQTALLAELFMKIQPLEARKTVLVSLYPAVDVQLEDLVAGTKTKLDDAFVAGLKEAIELAAEQSDIELPNLDAGSSRD